MKEGFDLLENKYGFRWGDVVVERTCSQSKRPQFQMLRIYAPNGQMIEIIMSPRKNRVEVVHRKKPHRKKP